VWGSTGVWRSRKPDEPRSCAPARPRRVPFGTRSTTSKSCVSPRARVLSAVLDDTVPLFVKISGCHAVREAQSEGFRRRACRARWPPTSSE
jgi:hypothetical protein